MSKTKADTAAFLRSHDDYLILTHRRPDGDAIGSAAALCLLLRALGKRAHILNNPQITPHYRPFAEGLIENRLQPQHTVISVDLASPGLFPYSFDGSAPVRLAIDHHGSNTRYAEASWIASECAACGEMIFALARELDVTLTIEMARALYLAISTDTGCFRYANVTADTLAIASALLACGVDAYPINKTFFETKRLPRLRLEAELTQNLALSAGGVVGVCAIPLALRHRLGLQEDDLDDISGFPRLIEGIEIGVVLREQEEGQCKISVRTSPNYDACAICQRLDGGGHKAAAGATVSGDVETGRVAVLKAIADVYPALEH